MDPVKGGQVTMLSFWRFATATAIGIVPASFLLTHFGDELATGEIEKIFYAVLALGAITLVSVLARYFVSQNETQIGKD